MSSNLSVKKNPRFIIVSYAFHCCQTESETLLIIHCVRVYKIYIMHMEINYRNVRCRHGALKCLIYYLCVYRNNVGHASTCNGTGLALGVIISAFCTVMLTSEDFCNGYLRFGHSAGGLITIKSECATDNTSFRIKHA